MQLSKISTLCSIAHVIRAHNGFWSYTSQRKYLELLLEHHEVKIGIRQLNYHLADLLKEGLIERVKRTHREANGQIHRQTTAIAITMKGWLLLGKKGISWAFTWLNKLRKKYLPQPITAGISTTEATVSQELPSPDSLKQLAQEAKRNRVPLTTYLKLKYTKTPRDIPISDEILNRQ